MDRTRLLAGRRGVAARQQPTRRPSCWKMRVCAGIQTVSRQRDILKKALGILGQEPPNSTK